MPWSITVAVSFEKINDPLLYALIAIVGGTILAISNAFLGPENIRKAFRDDRERTRSAIEADHVIPEIASLVSEIGEAMGYGDALARSTVAASLNSVDYLGRLRALSQFYGDYSDCDRLMKEAGRWSRRRGQGLMIFVPGISLAFGPQSLGWNLPSWIMPSGGALLLVGLTVAGISWWQETSVRNRLNDTFVKYG
jgi:hypothetical protein